MANLNKRIAAAVMIAALAAPVAAKLMEDTVANVNGTPIMLSEYQKELATAMEYWSHNEPDALRDPANLQKLRETTLEELINRELLRQEALDRKIKVHEVDLAKAEAEIKARFRRDPGGRELTEAEAETAFQKQLKSDGLSYDQFRENLKKQILARKLVEEAVRSQVASPTEVEVKAYFRKITSYIASGSTEPPAGMSPETAGAFQQIAMQIKGMSSERVRVSRILVRLAPNASPNEKKRALKTVEAIRAELQQGTSTFAEIARGESEDPISAPQGGDIGYLVRGMGAPELEDAAFSLPLGQVSQPILTENGYNLIRVQEKRAAEAPDFERFKDDLAKFMMNIRFQEQLETFVKSLKEKAVVERHLPTL